MDILNTKHNKFIKHQQFGKCKGHGYKEMSFQKNNTGIMLKSIRSALISMDSSLNLKLLETDLETLTSPLNTQFSDLCIVLNL